MPRIDGLPPGTLVLLILRVLARQPRHGYAIAQAIAQLSEDELSVEEGSLYPALQRLLLKGWVTAEWAQSANNRRARFYRLTPAGQRQLGVEEAGFNEVFGAILRVLKTDG